MAILGTRKTGVFGGPLTETLTEFLPFQQSDSSVSEFYRNNPTSIQEQARPRINF